MAKQKVVLLGLNELNFDFIKHYISKGHLPNFKHIFEANKCTETLSENEYKLLEPWIQWLTICTGKTYAEHQVFRLGDIVNRKDLTQIFEVIEANGYTIGAVSPFNIDNRLKNPRFFVPDPWTQTQASGDNFVKQVSKAVSQAVNDNAKDSVSKSSVLAILKTFFKVVPPTQYAAYLKLALQLKTKVGIKAVILDKLLGDLFLQQWKKYQPDFSNLFLNTGAHFQHHYMFNSDAYTGNLENPEWYCPKNQDPLLMILKQYDKVIGKLQKLNVRLLIATGLHQKPHKHNTFYWRLKTHEAFLKKAGVASIKVVTPRMSRDFLVEFNNEEDTLKAQDVLESYKSQDGTTIFTIDNRKTSLFVELTYPNDIDDDFSIFGKETINNFKSYIAFVAIKNGEHHGTGYYIDTNVVNDNKVDAVPLKEIYNKILNTLDIANTLS